MDDFELIPEDDDLPDELTSSNYPWTRDPDEQRRCFVYEHIATTASEIDGAVLVRNMILIADWLKTGKITKAEVARKKPTALKVVEPPEIQG